MNGKWAWKSKLQLVFGAEAFKRMEKGKVVQYTAPLKRLLQWWRKDVASGQKQNNWGRRSFMKSVVENQTC